MAWEAWPRERGCGQVHDARPMASYQICTLSTNHSSIRSPPQAVLRSSPSVAPSNRGAFVTVLARMRHRFASVCNGIRVSKAYQHMTANECKSPRKATPVF